MSDLEGTIIKPSLAFLKMSDGVFLSRFITIDNALENSTIYATAPVPKADRTAAIEAFTASMAASLDGSKKAKAALRQQRRKMTVMLRDLGHYVESQCKGSMEAFLASGFEPVPTTRTPTPPLTEGIRSIDHGDNSGQVVIQLKKLNGASNHYVRYSPMANGAAPNWIEVLVTRLRPPLTINGLIPGTTYAFQTRAATKDGYTDWSDSVTFICT